VGAFVVAGCVFLFFMLSGKAIGQTHPPSTTYMSDAQIQALSTLCGKPAPIPNDPLPKKDHEDSFVPCVELRMLYVEWCGE
jgi:hypothetical protein